MTERYRRNGKQVIVDDRHYCDARDEAAAADIVRTMNLADELQLFNPDITRPLPPPGSIAAWNRDNEALEDFRTHRRGWRELLVKARDEAAPATEDTDDRAYWEHELRAFDRIAAVATNRWSQGIDIPAALVEAGMRHEGNISEAVIDVANRYGATLVIGENSLEPTGPTINEMIATGDLPPRPGLAQPTCGTCHEPIHFNRVLGMMCGCAEAQS